MCCSFIGQVIFGALIAIALGLTLASMFTPGWRNLEKVKNSTEKIPKETGLFPFLCRLPNEGSDQTIAANESAQTPNNHGTTADYCKDWWSKLSSYEKVVIAAMCAAVVMEIVTLIWTILTIFACCCNQCPTSPMSGFAFTIAVLLAVAVAIYGTKYRDTIAVPSSMKVIYQSSETGYSFYLACGALAAAMVGVPVGICTTAFAKRCL